MRTVTLGALAARPRSDPVDEEHELMHPMHPRHPRHPMRPATPIRAVHRVMVATAMLAVALLSGCDRRAAEGSPDASVETSGGAAVEVTDELLATAVEPHPDFAWDAIEGAAAYRVRAWAGHRLLFDVKTREARLASTPALERPLLFYPGAVLRIQAESADGLRIGEAIEIRASDARVSAR